jgi:ubiquinone/menaquinone biosynthesis C-methylase UbiE
MSNHAVQTPKSADKQPGQMGRYAPYYDLLMTFLTLGREKKLRQTTLDLAQIKPSDRVLEIGSGTGTLTLAAASRVGPSGEARGIDIAPEMVAVANRKAARVGRSAIFQVGSIAKIPYPDNRFDNVMCSFMIFHMPEDVRNQGFSEISRVLKPGGHLSIIDAEDLHSLEALLTQKAFEQIEISDFKMAYIRIWFLGGVTRKK